MIICGLCVHVKKVCIYFSIKMLTFLNEVLVFIVSVNSSEKNYVATFNFYMPVYHVEKPIYSLTPLPYMSICTGNLRGFSNFRKYAHVR